MRSMFSLFLLLLASTVYAEVKTDVSMAMTALNKAVSGGKWQEVSAIVRKYPALKEPETFRSDAELKDQPNPIIAAAYRKDATATLALAASGLPLVYIEPDEWGNDSYTSIILGLMHAAVFEEGDKAFVESLIRKGYPTNRDSYSRYSAKYDQVDLEAFNFWIFQNFFHDFLIAYCETATPNEVAGFLYRYKWGKSVGEHSGSYDNYVTICFLNYSETSKACQYFLAKGLLKSALRYEYYSVGDKRSVNVRTVLDLATEKSGEDVSQYKGALPSYAEVQAGDPRFSALAGEINDSKVRLRTAPSLNSDVVTVLAVREPVSILGFSKQKTTTDGSTFPWIQVRTTDGKIGWCFGKYVSAELPLTALYESIF